MTVGVTLGVTLGVTVGVTVGVAVGVAVGVTLGVTVGVGVGVPPHLPPNCRSYSTGLLLAGLTTTVCAGPGRPVNERWLAELPSMGLGISIIIGLAGSTTLSLGLKSKPVPWPPNGMGMESPL